MVASPGGLSVVNDLVCNEGSTGLFYNAGLNELHLQITVFCGVIVVDVYGHGQPFVGGVL